VDLPEPDGPMTATVTPAKISRVTPDRPGAPPKSLVTSSRCNMQGELFSMLLISLSWRVKHHGASIALSGSAGTTLGCMWRKRKRHAKGTTHEQIQAEKIAELTKSRRAIADAYEVERSRIERDLHDGTQQYL